MAQVFPGEKVIVPFEPPNQRLIFKVGDIIHLFSRPDRLYEIVSLETRLHGKEPYDYWEDIARLRKYVEIQNGMNCIPYFRKSKYKNTEEISNRPDPLATKEIILQYYDNVNPSYTVFVTRKWYNAKKREYGLL